VVILLAIGVGKDVGAKIASSVVEIIGISIQFRSFGANVACTEIVCRAWQDA
jgi:hypothetical protein